MHCGVRFQVLHLLQLCVYQAEDRAVWWCTEQDSTPRSPWALSRSSGDPVHRVQPTGSCGFGLIPLLNRYGGFKGCTGLLLTNVLCIEYENINIQYSERFYFSRYDGCEQTQRSERLLTPLTVCSLQDLLPELQTVCQCYEAVVPPVVPVVTPAEVVPTEELEPKPEKTPEAKQMTGTKRKRTCKDASGPPAKKILGDGTRSPTTPVTWRSSSTGIVIKLV